MQMHRIGRAALAGTAGAAALTTLHEGIRQISPSAPRMDVVAMQGLARLFTRAGLDIPSNRTLRRIALAGDVLSNTAYYAFVSLGRPSRAPLRGAVLGVAAGLGALMLPERVGLHAPPHSGEHRNQAMTVGWYVVGGIVAGCVHWLLDRRTR